MTEHEPTSALTEGVASTREDFECVPSRSDSIATIRLSDCPSSSQSSSLPASATEPTRPPSSIVGFEQTDREPSERIQNLDLDPIHVDNTNDSGILPSESAAQRPGPGQSVPLDLEAETHTRPRSSSSSTQTSVHSGEVNWDELERSEEQEARDESSDESTALLLARLEQENNALATDPKSGLLKVQTSHPARVRPHSQTPSIHYLKSLLDEPTPPSLRYSLLPAPPPLTDLEFYAALVADYPRTAQCLPTLLSKKIRSGVPPPLRGIVWISMSGARDEHLEDQFDKLSGEPSPYETLIGKDQGRSFPGVEMFKEADGEGQRKLGRVLKCFSLYDQAIGYCQGMGFLVGPLLMHMDEKEAFCVLVRLMEHYDLRSCFLPDLSGLHLRIYQFRHLLAQHLPSLSIHLESLQVNPAYVSQWFLSFFAVTCPLPMLLRIYDVIFAEGVSETLMRVALSLMRRNEAKILACAELDDVMQLLLSRSIWDTYSYNADNFVSDFVGLTSAVAREGLLALQSSFKLAQEEGAHGKLGSVPDLQAAASRFLGRFWAVSGLASGTPTKLVAYVPGLAPPSRPNSFLRRSPSKQSFASTLNSCEVGSESGISSTVLTDATTMSRQPSGDGTSIRSPPNSAVQPHQPSRQGRSQEKDLHGQIEDLVTALSEMQKDQVVLSGNLKREREAHEQNSKVIGKLLEFLKREDIPVLLELRSAEDKPTSEATDENSAGENDNEFSRLLRLVEKHFLPGCDPMEDSASPTRPDFEMDYNRLKVQYESETSKCQQLTGQVEEQNKELAQLKEQLRSARSRIQESHKERQRLESVLQEYRARKSSSSSCSNCSTGKDSPELGSRRSSNYGGLREFKLNKTSPRTSSNQAPLPRRTTSMNTQAVPAATNQPPLDQTLTSQGSPHQNPDQNPVNLNPSTQSAPSPAPVNDEALLLELVNSKTAEALAKQEVEELRSKVESLKKMLAGSESSSSVECQHGRQGSVSQSTAGAGQARNVFNSFMPSGQGRKPEESNPTSPPPTMAPSGGFWTGWGKRSISSNGALNGQ